MRNPGSPIVAFFFCTLFALSASAGKIRLIYGENWCRAGKAIRAAMSTGAFKSAVSGRYNIEFVNADKVKDFNDLTTPRTLPAIQLLDGMDRCFKVFDNVPHDITSGQILQQVKQADAFIKKAIAEAAGFKTPDDCGNFLVKLEPHVGGHRRAIAKGYYADIFEKLKSLDPQDKTGWQRRFQLGVRVEGLIDENGKVYNDGGRRSDGLGIVIKANNFRERGKFYEGEAYLREQERLPDAHLTVEQKQAIQMARFALYREDASKQKQMIEILTKVAEAGETTFWGTAAVGWLNTFGEPPLSTYWGWREGDFKGPKLNCTIKYGVDHSFPQAGRYTLKFIRDDNSAEKPRIEAIRLMAGTNAAVTVKKPTIDHDTTIFEVNIPPEWGGKITSMIVAGKANPQGRSSGKIRTYRHVLRPRKESSNASLSSLTVPKKPVAVYLARTFGRDTLKEIARREGGTAFLRRFFADFDWMEQFAGSGMWDISPTKGLKDKPEYAGKAIEALDLLVWNDRDNFIQSKIGRNIATALAISHGRDWSPEKLVEVMGCYREWAQKGTLYNDAWEHDVRRWREVLGFGQNDYLPVVALRWIHDFANLPARHYHGLAWACNYRLFNCFGASVHGPGYYRPWWHRWNEQELRFRVGGVCGALSKFGSHGAASHGIRSFTAGEPGHCAYVLWNYGDNRWTTSYSVTLHTDPHNSLGGRGYAALEEQERYYSNPKRMAAERLRWKGDFPGAMRMCPGNFHAGVNWIEVLREKNKTQKDWDYFGQTVRETFNGSPSQGWALYREYLKQTENRDERLAAACAALRLIRESPEKTVQKPYWDEIALNPLGKMFEGDDAAMWELFKATLQGQAKTPSFYQQSINWFAGKLMKDGAAATKFLAVLGENARKTGEKLDYRGMICKASDNEDHDMWRQVFSLVDKCNPELKPKLNGGTFPKKQYGGTIISQEGMLKLSSTCEWDSPISYRNALDADDFNGGNAFHTGESSAPWAMVILPGFSEINGITVVNSGGAETLRSRQVPLRIWLSEDGDQWRQVYASDKVQDEWQCPLRSPIKAKYIKVGRAHDPSSDKRVFHLHKILVYGKKLY